MKAYLLLFIISIFVFTPGCKKNSGCTPVSPDVEAPQIVEYNTKNGITTQQFSNKVYYKIVDTGYGAHPTASSSVVVTYSAKLLNNTVFDVATSPVTFKLSDVIEGWQIGLPLLQKGGRMILIIPSAYAYGCNGNSKLKVSENSVLFYDINLIDIIP